jgi:hypothetical protein
MLAIPVAGEDSKTLPHVFVAERFRCDRLAERFSAS